MPSPLAPTDVDHLREQKRSDLLTGSRDLIATAQMIQDEAIDARARSREVVARARRAFAQCQERCARIRAIRSVRVAASGK
jgi:hypothetical protein